MNVRLNLTPTDWRAAPPLDPTHRSRKRHLSRTEAIALLAFVAGLLTGAAL